ncbi:type II secretion system F family protein [Candidatus Uhrbacteria bacterium]|jgi:type IV pilus assembly protein PilC|nr:type II secretion system F family protein [Candidatus Uhrbacteria bacterium]MBT7717366.1 type II secretion system F family protein [Candidatus Uhrbacteria bacterium]
MSKEKSPKIKKEKVESKSTDSSEQVPIKKKVSLSTRLNVRLGSKEKVLFVKYMSVLLESGLPLDQALDILLTQSKGPLKKILESVSVEIQNGKQLADGLEHYPHIFSEVFINLIRAGENTGTLKENLAYLAEQAQKQYDLKQSIRGSMMYPIIVLLGGAIVSVFIIVFIFPNIVALFDTLDVELPFATKVLLWIADVFENYPLHLIAGIILAIALFIIARKIRTTRYILDAMFLRVPIVGRILRDSTLSNVFRLLGTLLESGMPLKKSIKVTRSTANNMVFQKMFDDLEDQVNQGGELVTVLRKYDHIVPLMSVRLIHVGAQTGKLEHMLLYLANFYSKEVDELSKKISVVIEPILIIGIGFMIGFLAFAIITPIYQVITSVG